MLLKLQLRYKMFLFFLLRNLYTWREPGTDQCHLQEGKMRPRSSKVTAGCLTRLGRCLASRGEFQALLPALGSASLRGEASSPWPVEIPKWAVRGLWMGSKWLWKDGHCFSSFAKEYIFTVLFIRRGQITVNRRYSSWRFIFLHLKNRRKTRNGKKGNLAGKAEKTPVLFQGV